ncbi:MAG: IclR family transcriptional regulator C-terminal domain-containing protein [Mesorhizobium sp.]
MSAFDPVRSVQRGLAVLRVISEHGPLTMAGIVSLCNLPQPTVVRLVETLMDAGYVYRQPGKAAYKITGRTLALSRGFDPHSRLIEIATPVVDQLHIEIGWPSNLAVFDGDAMVIAYSNRAALGLSIPGRVGARIPLLATGVGLVTLARMPAEERRAAMNRARASGNRWDNDTTLLSALPQRLDQVRRQGHAFAEENYLDEVYQSRIWAVAVPVVSPEGEYVALSSLVLRMAGDRKRQLAKILPRLKAAAEQIGGLLSSDYA